MIGEKSSIIKAITNPLGFFALSLLVVEGFLGIVLVASNLEVWQKFWGMVIGAILFTLVGFGVWLIVWFNPENIVKAGEDYVEIEKIKAANDKRVIPYKERNESTAKNVKTYRYDEPAPEEIEESGDLWIQNQIDIMRGK